MTQDEKNIAKQATLLMLVGLVLGVLLVLDLLNRGLVWRLLQTFRSPNNSTLPGDKRSLGSETDLTYLS